MHHTTSQKQSVKLHKINSLFIYLQIQLSETLSDNYAFRASFIIKVSLPILPLNKINTDTHGFTAKQE